MELIAGRRLDSSDRQDHELPHTGQVTTFRYYGQGISGLRWTHFVKFECTQFYLSRAMLSRHVTRPHHFSYDGCQVLFKGNDSFVGRMLSFVQNIHLNNKNKDMSINLICFQKYFSTYLWKSETRWLSPETAVSLHSTMTSFNRFYADMRLWRHV